MNTVPVIDSSVSSPPAPRVSLARIGALRLMASDRAEEIIEIGYRSAAEQLARWKAMQTHD